MNSHSASETVRGSLLTVSKCAKGIKETRRCGHNTKDTEQREVLRARENLLALGQRFIASGLSVIEAADAVMEVVDESGTAVRVSMWTKHLRHANPSSEARLYIHTRAELPHLFTADSDDFVVSRDLVRCAPRLVLTAYSSWNHSTGKVRSCLDELGFRACRLEHKPGRLHIALLSIFAGVTDATCKGVLGMGVLPTLAFAGLLVYSGNRHEALISVSETKRLSIYKRYLPDLTDTEASTVDRYLMKTLSAD